LLPAIARRNRAQYVELRRRGFKRERRIIFLLPLQNFGQSILSMLKDPHDPHATLWRVTVEAWRPGHGVIEVGQNVSTHSPKAGLKIKLGKHP
jgi:hypothetical protein